MMDTLAGLFTKIMILCITVIGLATIFLIFISYNVTLVHGKIEREAYIFGDYLLASKCLTVEKNSNVEKSKFSEAKLNVIAADPSCIKNFYSKGKVEVKLLDSTKSWEFEIGPHDNDEKSNFIVAVKMNDGTIKPANMLVTL